MLRDEEVQNPQPRRTPFVNRYHTPVFVEYICDGRVCEVKFCGDLQIAWIWVYNRIKHYHPQSRVWRMNSFEPTAKDMEDKWEADDDTGYTVAKRSNERYKMYFEPDD